MIIGVIDVFLHILQYTLHADLLLGRNVRLHTALNWIPAHLEIHDITETHLFEFLHCLVSDIKWERGAIWRVYRVL